MLHARPDNPPTDTPTPDTTENSSTIDMAVVDCLLDDVESVETIIKLLNARESGWRDCWSSDFTEVNVEAAIRRLLKRKFIDVLVYHRVKRHLIPTQNIPSELNSPEVWLAVTEVAGRVETMEE